ncbi:MAG: HAMP domain-containing histidine kinase [Ignavibacteria bacterium]|nr:HAMP domain-containing histidine kinase [Ignavibacteria bacterium]
MKYAKHIEGEVAGSFLLGISASFAKLNIITEHVLKQHIDSIDPNQWYPCSVLADLLNYVMDKYPHHDSIFFNAGIHFIKIWYEYGPGKSMIASSLDWLYTNAEGQGYNTVVRGRNINEVGWCRITEADEKAGIIQYENVTMLPTDVVKGVFYGGCLLFNDMDFVSVETVEEDFAPNPFLSKIIVTVRFRLKRKHSDIDLDDSIQDMKFGETVPLAGEELESLKWRYKHLLYKINLDAEYSSNLSKILVDHVNKSIELTRELEEQNAIKDKFFTILAHDLRSPFSVFLNISDILDTEYASLSQVEIRRFSRDLNMALHRQYELLTDLLEWSRMQLKNYALNFEFLNLNKLAYSVVDVLASVAKQKGIEIVIAVGEEINAYADLNMLKLVLRNLISNSIKFTAKNGRVGVTASIEKDYLVITVADNGIGMPAESLQKLFVSNTRFTSPGTMGEKGTGLGLMLCKEIVEKHRGTIHAESEAGRGSKFIFTLPHIVQNKLAAL